MRKLVLDINYNFCKKFKSKKTLKAHHPSLNNIYNLEMKTFVQFHVHYYYLDSAIKKNVEKNYMYIRKGISIFFSKTAFIKKYYY